MQLREQVTRKELCSDISEETEECAQFGAYASASPEVPA